jgi:hypothetical protein
MPRFVISRPILAGSLDGPETWICPADGLPGVLTAPEGRHVELKASLYVIHAWRTRPGDRRSMFPHTHRHGRYWISDNHALLRRDYPELYDEYIGEVHGKGQKVAPSRLRGSRQLFRGVQV